MHTLASALPRCHVELGHNALSTQPSFGTNGSKGGQPPTSRHRSSSPEDREGLVLGLSLVLISQVSHAQTSCLICESGPTPQCGNSFNYHYEEPEAFFGYYNNLGVSGPYCHNYTASCISAHLLGCGPGGEGLSGEAITALTSAVRGSDVATIGEYLSSGKVTFNAVRGTLQIVSCKGGYLFGNIRLSPPLTLAVQLVDDRGRFGRLAIQKMARVGSFGNGAFRQSLD